MPTNPTSPNAKTKKTIGKKELKALMAVPEEPAKRSRKKKTTIVKEINIAIEEDLDDILDVIEGCRTVDHPVAEVIGHSFNKKSHILKNLFIKMQYNFNCDREFVNAVRMYNNAKPSLKEEIYHYIFLLDKKEKGILDELLKVKSAGSRSSESQPYDPVLNAAKVQGFFNYEFEEQILDF